MFFNTYITEQFMIDKLLNHGWIVINNTWTDCPQVVCNKLNQDYED